MIINQEDQGVQSWGTELIRAYLSGKIWSCPWENMIYRIYMNSQFKISIIKMKSGEKYRCDLSVKKSAGPVPIDSLVPLSSS